jgi:L,D-transpeptidase YcbB
MRGGVRTWFLLCAVGLVAACGDKGEQAESPVAEHGVESPLEQPAQETVKSSSRAPAADERSPAQEPQPGLLQAASAVEGEEPALEAGAADLQMRLDPTFAASVMEKAGGGAETVELTRLYEANGWHSLFLDPHFSSRVAGRFMRFILAAHELGLDPHELWFEEILAAADGACRVRFFEAGDELAELEQTLASFVPGPPPPHLGLSCKENWRPPRDAARKLDVLLGLAYVRLERVLSLDATAEERRPLLFPGAERAVAHLVSLLPPNHRYFGRVAALRNLLPYWSTDTFPVIGRWGSLRKGDKGPRVARLKRRLVAEGYLTAAAAADHTELFDNETRRAVLAYRKAYGLTSTGKVGPEMLAWVSRDATTYIKALRRSLNTTLVEGRERQATYILVNVPKFSTHFIQDGITVASYRSIVGFPYEEPGGRTPVLSSMVEYVDFNPTWTPTPWVVENELLRKAKKNPAYFADNHFTRRNGKWVQTPGPHNTLGQAVVSFPNDNLVKLHGTNEPRRFDYRDRALSHGCVRVENIQDLAMRVLTWSGVELDIAPEKIMSDIVEKRISPPRHVPVHIIYDRVHVQEGRAVAIAPDPYKLDRRLARKENLDFIYRLVTRARKSRRLAQN